MGAEASYKEAMKTQKLASNGMTVVVADNVTKTSVTVFGLTLHFGDNIRLTFNEKTHSPGKTVEAKLLSAGQFGCTYMVNGSYQRSSIWDKVRRVERV